MATVVDMTDTDLLRYDSLSGPELDPNLWEYFTLGGVLRQEPGAATTVADGVITIDVPRFTIGDDSVQGFDNCKHVILATQTRNLPTDGVSAFEVDIAVDRAGGDHDDYRLGAASFNIFDVDSVLVYDIWSTQHRVYGLHERLGDPTFSRVIDSPFVPLVGDGFRTCRIELEPPAGRATWKVDGRIVFEARGLTEFPAAVRLGFGFFSAVPTWSGEGSLHGQGARASWRGFRYALGVQ